MRLPVLEKKFISEPSKFLGFWSKLYTYPLEHSYNENVLKEEFSSSDIQNLFIWKNGMNLSVLKQKSFDSKIKSELKLINNFKFQKTIDLDKFRADFNNLSATWKIFLLHIIKPLEYPIYDQHIHRAHNYFHSLDYRGISTSSISNAKKEQFYFGKYLDFIRGFENINLKKLDGAFFHLVNS